VPQGYVKIHFPSLEHYTFHALFNQLSYNNQPNAQYVKVSLYLSFKYKLNIVILCIWLVITRQFTFSILL